MKKALSLFLSIVLVLGIFMSEPFTGSPFKITAEAASSGTCGTNVNWSLDDNGVLTISGTGAMNNYSNYFSNSYAPWYSSRSGIKEVVINKGVTSIGLYAFYNCDSLTSITIPDSVTSIGWYAFCYCTSLTSITVPDSVTSIGRYAFRSCTSLTSITIPDSVTSIGGYAFRSCTSLTSITIPDSVTSIGEYAFYDTAYYNDSSNRENGVLYIDNHLIDVDESISGNYEIKAGTKTIAGYAFDDCRSLTSITIPDSVTSIGYRAFNECSIDAVYITDLAAWCGIEVEPVDVNEGVGAPSTPLNYATLYLNGELLTDVVIPEGVTKIGNYAFYKCRNITSITIPASVVSIGKDAFLGCSNIKSVYISDMASWCNINFICDYANGGISNPLYYAKALYINGEAVTEIVIPEGVERIDNCAFEGFNYADSITLPVSLKKVGENAFAGTDFKYVFYAGDEETKNSVAVEDGNNYFWKNSSKEEPVWHYNTTDHIYTEIIVAQSNCTSYGLKYDKCNVCEYETALESIPATGHTSSDWTTDKAATVNAAGSKHKECTACGAVLESVAIPQLKPATPTLSKATNVSGGVTVTWKAVSGADSYRVYRKTSSSGWTCLNSKVKSTSYTDKSAKSGTTYYYTVRAENEAGLSGYNPTGVSVKYLAMPTVTIANASTGVKVSWNKISGASKYYVYRKASGATSWTLLTNSATGTSYTDTKAKSGTTYYYTVRAVSGSVASAFKSSSALKYLAQPKVSSLSNANSGITVKWGKITGASGYYVYRKTGSGSWSLIYTAKSGSTVSYTDKSAKAGTTYYYTVRAYSGSAKSTYTSSSAIRRLTTPTLKSVSSAKSGITFKWNKVTGASGYYVYRKTGSGSWQKIATIKSGSTVSYLDKTAKKGTTYTYTVRAYYSSSISCFNTTGLKIKDKY